MDFSASTSRMAKPQLRPFELIKKKPIPRRTGRDIKYKPTPIEMTLRARQTLSHSVSDSFLTMGRTSPSSASSSTATLAATMPRITVPGRFPGWSMPAEHIAEDPLLLALSDHRSPRRARSPSPRRSATPKGEGTWHGLITGGQKVDIPFDMYAGATDQHVHKDTDRFVHWYQKQQDLALHKEETLLRPEVEKPKLSGGKPRENALPWASFKHDACVQLDGKLEPTVGTSLRLFGQAELYDNLNQKGPIRGPEALCLALAFRLGGEDNLLRLNVNDDDTISFMEFSGTASISGVDVETVLGSTVEELFLRMDPARTGVINVEDLFMMGLRRRPGAGKKKTGGPARKVTSWHQAVVNARLEDIHPDAPAARKKWGRIARWMGIASLRHTVLQEERSRAGWKINEAAAGVLGDPLTEEQIDKSTMFVTGENEDGEPTKGGDDEEDFFKSLGVEDKPEIRQKMSLQRMLTEAGTNMRDEELLVKPMFKASASVQVPDGPQLMNREDMHNFFADLPLADPKRQALITPLLLDKLYDEAVALQCNFTKIGSGLNFWSFKAVLNNAINELGFGSGFRRIAKAMLPDRPEDMEVTSP